jgi:HAD superfamily hydrolase (TIGR01509 family)
MQSRASLKNLKAIIFDMDGVIVDSEKLHTEAELSTCTEYQIKAPMEEWDKFRGRTGQDFFSHLIQNFCATKHDVMEVLEYNSRKYFEIAQTRLQLVPGALDFLKLLKEGLFNIGLATSGRKSHQEMVFHKFSLQDYFDAIITGDEIINGKPHPEPYVKIVKKLLHKPQECLVIEDAINGIVSAKAAGCLTAGITTSFDREKLLASGADMTFDQFGELNSMIF